MNLHRKQCCSVWGRYSNDMMLCLIGILFLSSSKPAWAVAESAASQVETVQDGAETGHQVSSSVLSIDDISLSPNQAATTVGEWFEQIAQAQSTITEVRIEETAEGLQILLETTGGDLAPPTSQVVGDALVIEVPNAVLTLTDGGLFEQFSPTDEIALIVVENLPGDRVEISITGTEAAPEARISSEVGNLLVNVVAGIAAAGAEDEDVIQILVTGERESRYAPSNATTATRTDTPLRDIPQSIQVIPQEVIDDQSVLRIGEALRNVSGVTPQRDFSGSNFRFSIRGFQDARVLRNGIRTGDGTTSLATSPNTIERIEVPKGPASVLFGQAEPGGLVNFITKQPLDEPFYDVQLRVGNFDFVEPSIDFTGPLTPDRRLTYRFNASYQNDGLFRDFVDAELFSIAPVLRYEFSDNTDLTLEYEYLEDNRTFDDGIFIDQTAFDLPRELFLGEPSDLTEDSINRAFLTLNHRFSDDIRLRSIFGIESSDDNFVAFRPVAFDPSTGDVTRVFQDTNTVTDTFSWQTELVSEFSTGPVKHQLLAGFDLTKVSFGGTGQNISPPNNATIGINAFNPVFDETFPVDPDQLNFFLDFFDTTEDSFGLFLQDQIELFPNLKLLLGGRLDFATTGLEFDLVTNGTPVSSDDEFNSTAFSPRVGIVYQPIKPVSIYGSFNRSFLPSSVATIDGELIEPERGRQFEVGVRAEVGNIAINLAAYDIVKSNISVTDPVNTMFSLPIGEATSRGIELDIAGEILDGWNIIASGFLNDAFVSEGDSNFPEGDTLFGAAENGARLWTTYEIQEGMFKGLGLGGGVLFVGDIEEQVPNDFVVPSYVSADASIFYSHDNWKAQLNFRNLFDEDFLESTNNTLLLNPGTPFTVIGTFSIRF